MACYTINARGGCMIYENTPMLVTSRLRLRRFTESDVHALYDLMRNKEVNTYLPCFPTRDMDEAKAVLQEKFLAHYAKPSAYRYAVCLKDDDIPIGYVCLAGNDSNDFGYALSKGYWHRGITTEASLAIVERIKNAGYAFITATHDINNPRSGSVMKNIGMTYKYSYVEQWQPKDFLITFRMYQLNFDGRNSGTYMKYWDTYCDHFIERGV
jgi:[ribosomal protein S5]-alanine N-acetyltransferase